MTLTIEKVVQNLELGEGPHWDVATQSLYFVDIFAKTINRYVPSTKTHTKAHFDANVTFIVPVEGEKNKFIVGLGRDIVILVWDGMSDKADEIKKLAEVDCHSPEATENRLNDGKCDTSGRLWAGTMGVEKIIGQVKPKMGSLYSYGNKILKKHIDQVGISNGIAWSKDNKKLFYIDSPTRSVDQFDFDITTGELKNRKQHFSLKNNNIDGFPDGMTMDKDENLWVAVLTGSKVIKIDSKKPETILSSIEIPSPLVTSLAWGGENLDELYVTTASLTEPEVSLNPPVGATIYRITGLGTRGLPMNNFKL